MGISANEFREFIIRPTLQELGVWSEAMEALLLGTAAQVSQFGYHIKQGKGLGIFNIDSDTHRNVWDTFLAFDPDKASYVRGTASQREFLKHPDRELITNFAYATAIAWGIYASKSARLPKDPTDTQALANIWYEYYPRNACKGCQQDFLDSYRRYVVGGPKLVA